ncbi:efflux RND transporter permease subunit [Aquimarina aggregata]|uniref:efflux RND transporter permease subunit n=1 Tax=Aquimarina aggregata TaxID=1642818 RepID=UPI002490ABF1|nr:efflux RND transporter permease subunit [Aquimarina aggregata]
MSNFSIKILFFTLSIIGILYIPFLSYKLIPDSTHPLLKISYTWPNASQFSLERKVTSKFEGIFSSLKGIKKLVSKSYMGYGEIFITYDTAANIEKERFEVSTLIRQVHSRLPKGVSYPTISYQRPDDNDIRLLSYSIIQKNDTDPTLFIDKILTPEITKNESVNSIKFEGITSYYYEIQYNTSLINSLRITVNELEQALQNTLTNKSLGKVISTKEIKSQEFLITYNTIQTKEALLDLPIKKVASKIIRLKNIASIIKKKSFPFHLFRINGEQTISFSVIADKSANQITLAKNIKKSISQLEKTSPSYHFVLTHDATTYLKKELKSIFHRTLGSFFFLLLFTIVVYRNMYYVLNLFISLLATLLISVIFFKIFDIAIHVYSLMSISISIGFVIDNAIIAMDHYIRNKDKKIIAPIFAATITTITPLLLITFLEDTIRLNLIDFSWALIIVLTSSIVVSFFLVPSLIKSRHCMGKKKWSLKKIKKLVLFNNLYINIIVFLGKFRKALSIILLLLFGLPLFLLPEQIENSSIYTNFYNNSIGNAYYKDKIRPVLDNYLGGVLKLFVENSLDGNFIENPKRTSLSIRIKTPFGSTISYINTISKKLEESLQMNSSAGIDFFQTTIHDKNAAQIDIYFNVDIESNFPYQLKGFVEKEVLTMGGADFTITGIGQSFGTSLGKSYDSSIVLTGYQYEKLNSYAAIVKKKLEKNNRIENVTIQSEHSWFVNTKKKYVSKNSSIHTRKILNSLYNNYSSKEIGSYKIDQSKIPIRLVSNMKYQNSSYSMFNTPFYTNASLLHKPAYDLKFKLIEVPDKIVKKNQEYQLALQYEFKGTNKHNELVKKEIVKEFQKSFISGFTIKNEDPNSFGSKDKNLYIPILICLFSIFSICAILLESFTKSLLIVSTVPITFIGLFFSLYYLKIGFSSGVYGGLILLVGLLVNSSIFIINEYLNYHKKLSSKKSYLKAFNKKIVPIIITIISTIVSLIPFLISDTSNNFWYPFAITICIGLFFSIITIIFILPIYLIPNKQV